MKTKTCTKCGNPKPLSEFSKDKQKKDGYRSDCSSCNGLVTKAYADKHRKDKNLNNMKWKTGVDKDKYYELLELQNQQCAICGTKEDGVRRLSIDHDYKTNYVRGLLCTRCNQGLGYFKDDQEILQKAISYLQTNLTKLKIHYGKEKNLRDG